MGSYRNYLHVMDKGGKEGKFLNLKNWNFLSMINEVDYLKLYNACVSGTPKEVDGTLRCAEYLVLNGVDQMRKPVVIAFYAVALVSENLSSYASELIDAALKYYKDYDDIHFIKEVKRLINL
jgi:hypothetical protein